MQLLDYIQVKTGKGFADIELYHGDLSAIPAPHDIDIVVLSAFPNDYYPTPSTLIGALHKRGLSVEALAREKEIDLRKSLWCWISKELSKEEKEKFRFHRILCFEPEKRKDDAAEYVADIFRCLNNFVFDDDINHVAMTTVAAGGQKASASKITAAILEAASFWLQRGLPLQTIKIVEINEEKANDLKKVFASFKEQDAVESIADAKPIAPPKPAVVEQPRSFAPQPAPTAPVPAPAPTPGPTIETMVEEPPKPAVAAELFDLFISYSHKNRDHVRYFIETLRQKHPSLRLFFDSDSIPKGGQWLREISRCIDKSKKVLVFLSKEFDESPACWDEFQCAKVRQNRTGKNVIMNIYLLNHPDLPTMFEIFNWIDCREADKEKLDNAISEVINSLDQ